MTTKQLAKMVLSKVYAQGESDPNEGVGMGWSGTYCKLCWGRDVWVDYKGNRKAVQHLDGCVVPFLKETADAQA